MAVGQMDGSMDGWVGWWVCFSGLLTCIFKIIPGIFLTKKLLTRTFQLITCIFKLANWYIPVT